MTREHIRAEEDPGGGATGVQPFTFADLFAGIGGFHAALHAAGGEGWFASEIDPMAQRVYERNWRPLVPHGDIKPLTEEGVMLVPAVDVLAAGFPCQPFSKSGFQRGMSETRGTLFWNIARVLEERRPPVVLLENVRNIVGPNHRDTTFVTIIETLRDLGYRVSAEPTILSPHQLPPWRGGRPQVRERVFIVGTYVGRHLSRTPEALAVRPLIGSRERVDGWDPHDWTLEGVLQDDDEIEGGVGPYLLSDGDVRAIETWERFLRDVLPHGPLPGFPIWADAFRWPAKIPKGCPDWKRNFLEKNAELYWDKKSAVDAWRGGETPEDAPLLAHLNPSRRKLEWQAGRDPVGEDRSLWSTFMHFRPSGIRAKRPSYLPALVAITQTSIIGSRRRRITPVEAARLQGLPDDFKFHWSAREGEPEVRQPDAASYKQAGNGVCVGAAYYVFREHVMRDRHLIERDWPHLAAAVLASPANPDARLQPHKACETPQGAGLTSETRREPAVPERGRGWTVLELDGDPDLLAR